MTLSKSQRKVLIVSENENFFQNIQSIIPKSDFYPVFYAKSGSEARRKLSELSVDIMIVDSPLPDEHGVMFARNFSERNIGILLLVNADMYDSTSSQVEEDGILTLPKPNSPEMFYVALKFLSAMTYKIEKFETENKSLQEKMQDIRIVNKAKWILIEQEKISESEAHRYIEKRAMDERKSRREIAEEIISKS